ncbi:hypothetical protein G7Y89_g12801 [Cudoniella acicularis]|uniref:NmrA-like domain-containing protein n=1 Tax=Cudoniella acicularis TaxID=354080 RepID=A0A8H4VYT9_9HELO|nr:hypothetical protein G7Y89_g12801 [Cudoniella acicularis]
MTDMRIAIAGSGGLAEIIAKNIHETVHTVLILSRYVCLPKATLVENSDAVQAQPRLASEGLQVAVVDYENDADLRYTLRGIDVVISTVSGVPQINLIDAAAHSGVQRFIPAEFEGSPTHRPNNDPLDRGKRAAIDRLRFWSHHDRHPMRFTIFTCGVFYERFGLGIGSSTGIESQRPYLMDVMGGTAEVVEFHASGEPIYISMTSVYDLARFITAALEQVELGQWRLEFRVRGDRRTVTEIIHWGAVCRGLESLSVSIIEPGDLRAHLEHATYYNDVQKVARVQELIATEQNRYDFTQPTLNQLVNITPTDFWTWLSSQYPPPPQ